MAGSTLAVVKRSIADHMPAFLGDGWTVGYGWPGDKLAQGHVMWLGAASIDAETTSMKAGRRRRTETIDLTVAFWANVIDVSSTPDDRQLLADELVIEAARQLDEWIADEGHLGVPELVETAWFLGAGQHEPGPSDRGEAALLTSTVRWTARLL